MIGLFVGVLVCCIGVVVEDGDGWCDVMVVVCVIGWFWEGEEGW